MKELRQLQKVRGQVADRIAERTAQRAAAKQATEAGGDPAELVGLASLIEADQRTLDRLDSRIAALEFAEAREKRRSRIVALGQESTALKVDYDADLVETAERWAADAVRLAPKLRAIWDRQAEAFGVIRGDIGHDLHNADTPEARKAVAELEADLQQRGADLSVLLMRWPWSQRGFMMEQPYHLPPLNWVGALLLQTVDGEGYRRAEAQGRAEQERLEAIYQAGLGGAA